MSDCPERQRLIFKKYLQDLRQQDGYWYGYLKSDDELKLFERALAAANVKYAVRSSREPVTSPKARIVYSMRMRGFKISLNNVPFRVLKAADKVCMFGVEYYKTAQENQKERDLATTDGQKKVRRNSKGTKKKGCPATMHLKWIEIFPDFKVDIPQPCGVVKQGVLKANRAKELDGMLDEAARTVASGTRIYVAIADSISHDNHGFDDAKGVSQRIDVDVAKQIETLVRGGITSVSDVKKRLCHFVHDVLFATKEKPDSSCKAFFPDNSIITSHIQSALRKDRFSSNGQENADNLVKRIKAEQPESSVFYRPCVASKDSSSNMPNNTKESIAGECEDTLLFCFQSKFMKNICAKYGTSVVCLDAAHRTGDCALSLFILVVKTPFGYTAAGVFIVQFETTSCIAEALNVFREWSPDLSPEKWMVDCSQVEMDAICQAFPGSKMFICDFHRIQAWQRWICRKENGVSYPEDALFLMESVASASNHDELEKALAALICSEHWQNEKFRSYFETVWLPVKELWVLFHRLEFGVAFTTNKGIEALNKMLRADCPKACANSGKHSVNSLIIALVYAFLPHCEKKYSESEARQLLLYRQYSENVPIYLRGRPEEFINHMLRRLVDAEEFTPADVIELPDNGMFLVRSESADDSAHTVDFGKPSCTCLDFAECKYPCKHFCAVFKLIDGWNFLSLPQEYLNEPKVGLEEPCTETEETCLNDGSTGAVDFVAIEIEVTSENVVPETVPSTSPTVSELRRLIVEECEKCTLLLDHCYDVQALTEAGKLLESAIQWLAESLPENFSLHVEGLMNGCSPPELSPKRRRLQNS